MKFETGKISDKINLNQAGLQLWWGNRLSGSIAGETLHKWYCKYMFE